MKCTGTKSDGYPCGSRPQKGFKTCLRHRDQEDGLSVPVVTEASEEVSAKTSKEPGSVTFVSRYPEHLIVLQGRRKLRTIDGDVVEQPGISAQFHNHQYTTSDSGIIEGLRGHVLFGSPELQEL